MEAPHGTSLVPATPRFAGREVLNTGDTVVLRHSVNVKICSKLHLKFSVTVNKWIGTQMMAAKRLPCDFVTAKCNLSFWHACKLWLWWWFFIHSLLSQREMLYVPNAQMNKRSQPKWARVKIADGIEQQMRNSEWTKKREKETWRHYNQSFELNGISFMSDAFFGGVGIVFFGQFSLWLVMSATSYWYRKLKFSARPFSILQNVHQTASDQTETLYTC